MYQVFWIAVPDIIYVAMKTTVGIGQYHECFQNPLILYLKVKKIFKMLENID